MDLSDDSMNRIVAIVQKQIAALELKVHARFNNIERRIANIENIIVSNFGANALPDYSRAPTTADAGYRSAPLSVAPHGGQGQQATHSYQPQSQAPTVAGPSGLSNSQNARFLPYAMEIVANKYCQKQPYDRRECSKRGCGRPTYHIDCFREEQFRWCRRHQRPILPPHVNYGRNFQDCEWVRWEHHPDWETIVKMSFAANNLGKQGIEELREILFPRDLYPNKYDNFGNWTG